MLGPEEFFQGLGLGLRSFLGAGVVGKLLGTSGIVDNKLLLLLHLWCGG